MSKSDEHSVQDADRNTLQNDRVHVFKTLEQEVTGSQALIRARDVRVSADLTVADLDTLLVALSSTPATARMASVPGWNATGFLAATASLLEQGRLAASGTQRSTPLTQAYAYNGRLYDLQWLSGERVPRFERSGRAFGPAIRSRLRVHNRVTGEDTPFTVVHGVDGELTDVPLLISFRPRWWIEIECVLADDRR